MKRTFIWLCLLLSLSAFAAHAQTTAFTYQGRLSDGANTTPTGTYQIQFALYDAPAGANQIGATITNSAVPVAGGVFTVSLDFGAISFTGGTRFLEIRIFSTALNNYVTLTPRQPITSAPYSIRALNAEKANNANNADNALNIGGTPASEVIIEGDSRLNDSRNPLAGSGNYIQNQNIAPQTSTNFRIDGTGSANILNAQTQMNLGNSRFMIAPGTNTFVGFGTGAGLTTGSYNTVFGYSSGASITSGGGNVFVGDLAGRDTQTGIDNSFFGGSAGIFNVSGNNNSFFGHQAGRNNLVSGNSFFGSQSGYSNTIGIDNAFFGFQAGYANTTGEGNTFIGNKTGNANTDGSANSFIGAYAGKLNTTGFYNTFVGYSSGEKNTDGIYNTFVGTYAGYANVGGDFNSYFGIGAGLSNVSGSKNSFFGNVAGYSNLTGNANSFFGSDAGFFNTSGVSNAFFGVSAGKSNTNGNDNAFFGGGSGLNSTTGDGNTFIGLNAGLSNTTENFNTFVGYNSNGAAGITNATAIGANAVVGSSNSLVLGNGVNVGIGTSTPTFRLHVVGSSFFENSVSIKENLSIESNGAEWSLKFANPANANFLGGLRLADSGFFEITNRANLASPNFARLDSSGNWTAVSDVRMKKNITPLSGFLQNVLQLRTFSFNYLNQSDNQPKQIGFMAQDVERFYPSLVTNGEIKTLNYAGLSVVAIGAIQEQQQQIEQLKTENESLRRQLEEQQNALLELRKLVCLSNPNAEICRK